MTRYDSRARKTAKRTTKRSQRALDPLEPASWEVLEQVSRQLQDRERPRPVEAN